ncbi:hypothetical protein [Streptomyces europaeiscabiei]|uniref:hypothetical protein n=1 Tax=Streptomyces europaeiscabiei TaxID=146819 RepID=UPI0029C010C5|nr:hypothetical protein [Streptomyces europaeiscabiei]
MPERRLAYAPCPAMRWRAAMPTARVAYVARTLSRSTAVTVPYVAHVVFADSRCAQTITTSFFARPSAPDTSCLAGLQPPQFEIAP